MRRVRLGLVLPGWLGWAKAATTVVLELREQDAVTLRQAVAKVNALANKQVVWIEVG